MHTPANHAQNLLHIIENHAQAPIAENLKLLVTDWQGKQVDIADLHAKLTHKLAEDIPSTGCCYTLFHNASLRHQRQLITELLRAISDFQTATTELVTIPANLVLEQLDATEKVPYAQEVFTNKLFLAYVAFAEKKHFEEESDEKYLIQNALLTLIDTYKQQSELYKSPNEKIKNMAQMRMLTLQDWLSHSGYQTFINTIIQTNTMIKKGRLEISIATNSKKPETTDEMQHILNWLSIIYSLFKAEETPLAISHIYRMLHRTNQTQTLENVKTIKHSAQLFLEYYLSDDCVVPINIDTVRMDLIASIVAIGKNSGNLTPSARNIANFHTCLLQTYEELRLFMIAVDTRLLDAYSTLSGKLSKENEAKFKIHVEQALDCIHQSRELTSSDDERRDSDALRWYSETVNARVERYKCESEHSSTSSKKDRSSRRSSSKISNPRSQSFSMFSSQDGLNDQATTSSSSEPAITQV